MSRLFVVATLFCLAVPAAFAVPPAGQNQSETQGSTPKPSQLCAAQLRTMGATNFQSMYAPTGNGSKAFGKCVSRLAQIAETSAENAAKACKTERGATNESIATFNEKYGTNAKKNAFGKCVSSKTEEGVEAQQDATLTAAKKCKAERGTSASSIADFNVQYGTKNKRNAFGKCVSKLAKLQGSSS